MQFHEGLARVEDVNGYSGFIDKTGFLKIQHQWYIAGDFCNGLAKVSKGGLSGEWGYIDKEGRLVIPYKWKNAKDFNNKGFAEVKDHNGKWYKINKKGEIVS